MDEVRQELNPESLLDVTVVVGADWSGIPGLRDSFGDEDEERNPLPGGD